MTLLQSPAQRNLPDAVMLTPDSVSLQEFVPRQTTSVHYPSPTFTVPSSHASCFAHDRKNVMTPSYRSSPTQTLFPHTPQSSSANHQEGAQANYQCEASRFYSKQRLRQSGASPHVSEEAMQLIQFCNHCSFEVSPTANRCGRNSKNELVHRSAPQNEPGFSSSDQQQTPGHHFSCSPHSNICSCINNPSMPTFQDIEDDNRYYPFITRPTGDHNLPLSQINSGSYYTEPGPPRELTIKKCPRGRKTNSSLCKGCKSLDDAIRPVVYDWNAWWEKEYIQCALNEESQINSVECWSDDIYNNKIPEGKRTIKTPTTASNRKKLNPSFLTPIMDGKLVSQSPIVQSKQCQGGKISIKTQNERDGKKGKGEDGKKGKGEAGIQNGDRSMSARKKMVSVCINLRLIVSIPFKKLITERQLKKYCGEGGKHRIGTQ